MVNSESARLHTLTLLFLQFLHAADVQGIPPMLIANLWGRGGGRKRKRLELLFLPPDYAMRFSVDSLLLSRHVDLILGYVLSRRVISFVVD
jgi:hypothetical protein